MFYVMRGYDHYGLTLYRQFGRGYRRYGTAIKHLQRCKTGKVVNQSNKVIAEKYA